jgi:hypothetical protein
LLLLEVVEVDTKLVVVEVPVDLEQELHFL